MVRKGIAACIIVIIFLSIIFIWKQSQESVEGKAVEKQKVHEDYLKVVRQSGSEVDVKREQEPVEEFSEEEKIQKIEQGWSKGNSDEEAEKREYEGNYLGYSLYSWQTDYWYKEDLAYLVEEDYVGKGIFVSEYISESEVFLGRVLQQAIEKRGKLDDALSSYFTPYARQQLAEVEWELLEDAWICQPYDYFRDYTITYPYGEPHYRFYYSFFSDLKKMEQTEEEVNEVGVELLLNSEGQIYYIDINISTVSPKETGTTYYIYTDPLCVDLYGEIIIREGEKREGLLFDFERYYRRGMGPETAYEEELGGFFRDGDMAVGAEQLKEMLVDMLKSQGANGSQYETWFEESYTYEDFLNADWQAAGKDWIAAREYDCLYFDDVQELGYVKFEYYFYPDFVRMNTTEAMAVVVSGGLSVSDGELSYVDVLAFPITQEEYEGVKAEKDQEDKKVLIVDKGELLSGKEKASIPIPVYELEPIPIQKYEVWPFETSYQRERINMLWGYTDAAQVADKLAGSFYQDMEKEYWQWKGGEVYKRLTDEALKKGVYGELGLMEQFQEEGWEMDEAYDCYYIKTNEVAETLHLQYYFYPRNILENQTFRKTLIVDVYLSEDGIEDMKINQIRIS